MRVGVFLNYIGLGANLMHLSYCHEIAKVFGRVSMDLTTVDVTNIKDCAVGDWCEFFSPKLPISEIAKSNNLISYYLMTGIKSRVKKIFQPI